MMRGWRFRRTSRRRPFVDAPTARVEHEVEAYVEARLLGIRLLALRAQVATGTPISPSPLMPLSTERTSSVGDSSLNGGSQDLVRAIDLLDQSSSTLRQLDASR